MCDMNAGKPGYGNGIDGDLMIEENEEITLESDKWYNYKTIEIKKNGKLTVKAWDSNIKKGGKLMINVMHNLILHKNASIHCNQKGYKGGQKC